MTKTEIDLQAAEAILNGNPEKAVELLADNNVSDDSELPQFKEALQNTCGEVITFSEYMDRIRKSYNTGKLNYKPYEYIELADRSYRGWNGDLPKSFSDSMYCIGCYLETQYGDRKIFVPRYSLEDKSKAFLHYYSGTDYVAAVRELTPYALKLIPEAASALSYSYGFIEINNKRRAWFIISRIIDPSRSDDPAAIWARAFGGEITSLDALFCTLDSAHGEVYKLDSSVLRDTVSGWLEEAYTEMAENGIGYAYNKLARYTRIVKGWDTYAEYEYLRNAAKCGYAPAASSLYYRYKTKNEDKAKNGSTSEIYTDLKYARMVYSAGNEKIKWDMEQTEQLIMDLEYDSRIRQREELNRIAEEEADRKIREFHQKQLNKERFFTFLGTGAPLTSSELEDYGMLTHNTEAFETGRLMRHMREEDEENHRRRVMKELEDLKRGQ